MQILNLTPQTEEEKLIFNSLQPMVSAELADKINNGVYIEKDGKRLLNKKTLSTFMVYLCEEAYKLISKDATKISVNGKSASVKGMHENSIMELAIHYFEEESIEGTLYNEDGTPYKKPVTVTAKPNAKVVPVTSPAPPKPQKQQTSIFDMLAGNTDESSDKTDILPPQSDNEDISGDEDEEEIAPVIPPIQSKTQCSPLYKKYMQLQSKYPDCIVFMRLGDFYEVLDKKAVTAAEVLDLTLTGRDCGLTERVPMCGIPYHAADNYFKQLIEKGYKIAVAEETTERVISGNKILEGDNLVNLDTGEIIHDVDDDELPIEELSVEEMEKFDYDGDGSEDDEEELMTVSKLTAGLDTADDEEDIELAYEKEIAKAIDKEALCILSDLFDGKINIA